MKRYVTLIAVLLLIGAGAAWAVNVPVPNGSFESPVVVPPATQVFGPNISPWFHGNPGSIYWWTLFTTASGEPDPTDGNQAIAWTKGGLYWLSGMPMDAGDTVTFTFDLNNSGWDMANDKYARAWLSENTDGGGATYTLDPETQYESIVITPDEIPFRGPWKTYTISDVVPQAQAGWYLNFRVLEYDGYIDMDNVRLDIAPVPEPGTLMVLGSGVLSLAGLAIRRRKQS